MTSWESRFFDEIIYFGLLNLLFTQNVTANFNINSNSIVNKKFLQDKFLKKRAENLKIIYKKVRHKKMLKIILYFLVVKKKSSSSELNYHIQVTVSLNRNSSISLLILKQFLKKEHILSAQIALICIESYHSSSSVMN